MSRVFICYKRNACKRTSIGQGPYCIFEPLYSPERGLWVSMAKCSLVLVDVHFLSMRPSLLGRGSVLPIDSLLI